MDLDDTIAYKRTAVRRNFNNYQLLIRLISRLFKIFGLLVSMTGVVFIKLVPIYFLVISIDYLKELFNTETWANFLMVVIFWSTLLFFSFPLGKRITGIGVRIMDYARRVDFKFYDLYGKDYEPPILEHFAVEKEEFYAYNRRFQFEISLVALLTFAPTLFIYKYVVPNSNFSFWACLISATSMTLITSLAAIVFNRWYSKKWPYWKRVNDFHYFNKVYKKIQDELREDRLGS